MNSPTVSVVVVSRGRPNWLDRCITGLSQLDYPNFEIVVVCCSHGLNALEQRPDFEHLKTTRFDEANISQARNLGIAASGGEIIAFIDDDAVPEPTWLGYLIRPFSDPDVRQTGGITLGRNGISVQHGPSCVDMWGRSHTLDKLDWEGTFSGSESRVPRTHGTNTAFRRQALTDIGGFDERFKFYLDETDVNLRIARAGGQTAFSPKAIVHHASASSKARRPDRTPTNVFDIGVSTALFHKKHAPVGEWNEARADFLKTRKAWLMRKMMNGKLLPGDVRRLGRQLEEGYEFGRSLSDAKAPVSIGTASEFRTYPTPKDRSDFFAYAWSWKAGELRDMARRRVAQAGRVTLFEYTPTSFYHRIWFEPEGFWRHSGGIFGREHRDEPLFRLSSRWRRMQESIKKLESIRYSGNVQELNVPISGK